jgi:hypothetical protein
VTRRPWSTVFSAEGSDAPRDRHTVNNCSVSPLVRARSRLGRYSFPDCAFGSEGGCECALFVCSREMGGVAEGGDCCRPAREQAARRRRQSRRIAAPFMRAFREHLLRESMRQPRLAVKRVPLGLEDLTPFLYFVRESWVDSPTFSSGSDSPSRS